MAYLEISGAEPCNAAGVTDVRRMQALETTLRRVSPRYTKPATPAATVLIHGGVACLWLLLFLRAFGAHVAGAWAVGIVYVLYDTALLVFTFFNTLPLLHERSALHKGSDAPAATRPATWPTLGVLIAAHNEAPVLAATIGALRAGSDVPDEIVVVDDGSDDDTGAVLARMGLATPAVGAATRGGDGLTWLRLPHGGKARALNRALSQIETDIVLTVDADTLLEAGAVAAMRRAFANNPGLVAATGILVPVCDTSLAGRVMQWFQTHEYLRNFLSRAAWARQDGLLLISGAFAGFRRAALLRVGGFDPDCLVEDYELIHRLRRVSVLHGLGWTTTVLGDARASTEAPSTIGAFLRQRRRWFGGFLQTQMWYRDMVGNARFGHLGTRMLPVKAADTMQPIYGLTAIFLLFYYLLTGRAAVVLGAGAVIGAKLLFDFGFYLWSVHLYRRWVGTSGRVSYGSALLGALIEPFTFQLLRHLGASLGWVSLLTRQMHWGARSRRTLPTPTLADGAR